MLIVTHPENVELLLDKFQKQQEAEIDFVHRIRPMPLGIEFRTELMMPKEEWKGRYLVEGNRFFTYWDGKGEPPDWALHFGFVKKLMEPVFYIVNQPTVFSPTKWG